MFKKTLIFIDGENLVFRFQEMLGSGRVKTSDTVHIPDAFVWHPKISEWSEMDVIRVSYYTSVQGDDSKLADISRRISETWFGCRAGQV